MGTRRTRASRPKSRNGGDIWGDGQSKSISYPSRQTRTTPPTQRQFLKQREPSVPVRSYADIDIDIHTTPIGLAPHLERMKKPLPQREPPASACTTHELGIMNETRRDGRNQGNRPYGNMHLRIPSNNGSVCSLLREGDTIKVHTTTTERVRCTIVIVFWQGGPVLPHQACIKLQTCLKRQRCPWYNIFNSIILQLGYVGLG